MNKKTDIFEVLKHIDVGDYQFIDSLTDDQRREVPPFLILKWMSFTSDKEKVKILASGANQYLFKLYKNPNILYKLLTASSNGRPEFYKWIKKKENQTKRPIAVKMLKEYYSIGSAEAKELAEIMNLTSMEAIADELGEWDSIKNLRKEYGNV